MINIIVNLYRYAVGILFVIGCLLAVSALLSRPGDGGTFIAVIMLGATVLLVGLSAVLISINDHLAAMRSGDNEPPPQLTQKQAIIGVLILFFGLAAAGFLSGLRHTDIPPAPPVFSQQADEASVSVKDGCVPELAAQIGRKCAD